MTYGVPPAPTAAAPKSGLLNGGSNWIPTSLGEVAAAVGRAVGSGAAPPDAEGAADAGDGEDPVARAFAKADVIVGPAARAAEGARRGRDGGAGAPPSPGDAVAAR